MTGRKIGAFIGTAGGNRAPTFYQRGAAAIAPLIEKCLRPLQGDWAAFAAPANQLRCCSLAFGIVRWHFEKTEAI